MVTHSFPNTTNQFKEHCILAFDGCHVVYSTNADIIEDYNVPRLVDYKGYNHMHLNGFVDVISKAFLDVMIQPGQHPDERAAMHEMLDHFNPDNPQKYIITADRGYESYDLIFQCELKKLGYVFRVKAPSSGKCILTSFRDELPDNQDEFDITIERFFTDKYNNVMKLTFLILLTLMISGKSTQILFSTTLVYLSQMKLQEKNAVINVTITNTPMILIYQLR